MSVKKPIPFFHFLAFPMRDVARPPDEHPVTGMIDSYTAVGEVG
jgi:hypothetical protein